MYKSNQPGVPNLELRVGLSHEPAWRGTLRTVRYLA